MPSENLVVKTSVKFRQEPNQQPLGYYVAYLTTNKAFPS